MIIRPFRVKMPRLTQRGKRLNGIVDILDWHTNLRHTRLDRCTNAMFTFRCPIISFVVIYLDAVIGQCRGLAFFPLGYEKSATFVLLTDRFSLNTCNLREAIKHFFVGIKVGIEFFAL